MRTEKSREDNARRRLSKHGFRLRKTPARSWLRAYYGPGYMITENNTVVRGCHGREYTDTLADVESYVADLDVR
ncbi:hypothetical protein EOA16_28030 [Mesorhizobium sp. M7A.F.Ca.US.008.03.1.1]|nr:hypothetical protein EOA16_28030 [Mesorhizobium sp. M7A.F.Ca.US.008.03.1.1]